LNTAEIAVHPAVSFYALVVPSIVAAVQHMQQHTSQHTQTRLRSVIAAGKFDAGC
jgi:gamma-glutamyl phosphate reductase